MILDKISVYCDGGARGNPGPGAAAFIAKDKNDNIIYRESLYLGKTTNNQAEYEAVLLALKWLEKEKRQVKKIDFYIDSLLVVKQLTGAFKIKSKNLQTIILPIKELELQLKAEVKYHHILRALNKQADVLVNRTLDKCC